MIPNISGFLKLGLHRQAYATLLPHLIGAGMGSNAAWAYASNVGVSLRRITYQEMFRDKAGMVKGQWFAENAKHDEPLQKLAFVEQDWKSPRRYKAVGEAEFFNSATGESYKQHVTLFYDQWGSPEDAEAEYGDMFGETPSAKEWAFVGITFTYHAHKLGASW